MTSTELKSVLATILAPATFVTTLAWSDTARAKTADRGQPMIINSDSTNCNVTANGHCHHRGNVEINQGTLEIRADTAEVQKRNGEIHRIIFTGRQATLEQQLEDNTWTNARADRIDYKLSDNLVVLTGNYQVSSIQGTTTGQKMVYNVLTGEIRSGGDGTRVRTVIMPKDSRPPNR
ncbi:lipopolysaccharide transport periplasmic protein LptA [Stenotrophomonas muris]|uniref:Lipopolysaccharide export system protein LptA n=1 Tax=Stenotrophomonas muris TaxID=2963283 RepID=A0ABU5MNK8_9GAMM|nr:MULTISPECIES: lipopolysaccharide transport periplasmic protein LptA [Gammaproteobacteria]MBH1489494.1 lipopolysaccharide transport periplasmic protein LptA [Stenotrophomonas maltophilia]MBN5070578.1 lipopolysaccharide transport periplasmic protein LptA [Stenotrophomonas maltophilia]MDZ7514341.1 lipopolysaccharide transport periplasmic protein LptA [Stenotrophomonas muris]